MKKMMNLYHIQYCLMLFLIIFHCFVLSHSSFTASNSSRIRSCLPDQSSALLLLKQELFQFDDELSFDPKMKFWKAGTDCCTWDGITCNAATGQVVSLDLSSSSLQGPLLPNSSFFSLHNLQQLNLAFNDFALSQIPSSFAQLSRLTHLNLSYSNFAGQIPYEISWLTNLVSLDLSSNYDLYGNPLLSHICKNLTMLKELHLGEIDLSSVPLLPQSLGNLSSLESLSLSECKLHGEFPTNIFHFPKIRAIDVSYNSYLKGFFPDHFQSSSDLRSLTLASTPFSGTLPDSISNLKSLNILLLEGCNISGTIPTSIGNLSQLTILDLGSNNFYGQLPSTLGNLVHVTTLDLSINQFSGQAPETLGNLSQLVTLDLSSNQFNGEVPATLGNLSQLTYLRLSSNNFNKTVDLPSTLGNLVNLTELNLRDTGIHGALPASLGNLVNLERLDIGNNGFNDQVPSFLGKLSQLRELFLNNNSFQGSFPTPLTNLAQLQVLDISNNNLTGVIPSSLFTIPSLESLYLSNNQFTGPLSIQNTSTKLKLLYIDGNKLSGLFPSSITKLTNLTSLKINPNNFSGSIDFSIFYELRELKVLDLSHSRLSLTNAYVNATLPKFNFLSLASCNISAEFPLFLKNQDDLSELDLSNNNIRGKIPEWFFRTESMKGLQELNLSYNSISSSEEAPFVFPWKKLRYVDLRSNMLEGPLTVPLSSTKLFYVSNNNFSGRIDQSFCDLINLEFFDVSNNNFGGTIPHCLINTTRLLVLKMQGNHFHGVIPQIHGDGSNLKTLDLSHNQLRGEIPPSLAKCKSLEVLNLGHNQISGTFPFWIQKLSQLQVLVLRSNKFHGPICQPHKVLSFENLRIIDLSFNNFSGNLPDGYFTNWSIIMKHVLIKDKSQLVNMIYTGDGKTYYQDSMTLMNKGLEMVFVKILTIFASVDLSNNNFHGEIPSSIGDLQSLLVLNLSSNNFEGLIPSSLGNLTELESLDLSKNKLFGRIPQELASLTFLEYLNLSNNRLGGPRPRGGQLDTFSSSSFEGNSELCGFELAKKCEEGAPIPDHSNESESESELGLLEDGFGWKAVSIGYGCGLVIGMIVGHCVISRRPSLFFQIFGRRI